MSIASYPFPGKALSPMHATPNTVAITQTPNMLCCITLSVDVHFIMQHESKGVWLPKE